MLLCWRFASLEYFADQSLRIMSVATPSTVPITRYADFWPHYLWEHSKPETRALHYAGTIAGTALWLIGLCTSNYKLVPAGVFVGEQAETPSEEYLNHIVQFGKLPEGLTKLQDISVRGLGISLSSTISLLHSNILVGP